MSNIILRENQNRFIDEIDSNFVNGNKRVLGVAPTGFGKTICFSHLATIAAVAMMNVFIAVHLRELVRQTSNSLTRNGIEHGIIAAGYPLKDTPIQVCSVQTLVKRLHLFQKPDDSYLMIFDEAHRSLNATCQKIMDWSEDAYRLGVTATPVRADGKPFTKHYDVMVEADDMNVLMDQGWLVRPTMFSPELPNRAADQFSDLTDSSGDYIQELDAQVLDRREITGSAIEWYRKICPHMPPTVVFCATVKHAHNVATQFTQEGIPSAAIDGSMNDDERIAILDRLKSGAIKCVMSCNLVSEGFDLPAVQCGIMLRRIGPKCLALFVQQVGRVLRPLEGKTECFLIDHVRNCYRFVDMMLRMTGKIKDPFDWEPYFLGTAKKKKKQDSAGKLIDCPKCFMTFPPVPKCPNCGHDFTANSGGGPGLEMEVVDGELVCLNDLNFAPPPKKIITPRRPVVQKLERI